MKSLDQMSFKAVVRTGGCALAMFGLAISGAAAASFTTFVVPQSSLTEPAGINDNGDVTGLFMPSTGGFFTGFLRSSDGTFTTFFVKNSLGTTPSGINRKGEIVGSWDGEFGFQGFSRTPDGIILSIDPRQASAADAQGDTSMLRINDSGDVAGDLHGHDGAERGFVRMRNGMLRTYSVSGSPLTRGYGLNSTGGVTGFYWDTDTNDYIGFVRTPDGTITPFSVSESQQTVGTAISDSGIVTGNFQNGATISGFVRSADGTIQTFDPPGSLQTNPVAINRKGEIAGNWFDGSQFHSFIRSAKGKITSFDPPGARGSEVDGFNNNGVVVGRYPNASGYAQGYIRTP